MKKTLAYLIFGILFLGCSNNENPKPQNLIPQDVMENIIYDINILQAIKNTDFNLYNTENIKPQEYIYKKYSIDSVQFSESNKYYIYNTALYEQMLDNVILRVKLEKDKATEDFSSDKLKKSPDSLKIEKLEISEDIISSSE